MPCDLVVEAADDGTNGGNGGGGDGCPPTTDGIISDVNQILAGNHQCPASSIVRIDRFEPADVTDPITFDESSGDLLKGVTQGIFDVQLTNVSGYTINWFDYTVPAIFSLGGVNLCDWSDDTAPCCCIEPYQGNIICEGCAEGFRVQVSPWEPGETISFNITLQVPSKATSVTANIFIGTDIEASSTVSVDSSGALAEIPGGSTAECTSNADCPDGTVCYEGHCVEEGTGGACMSNADCPSGEKCASGTCVPITSTGCTTDSDCGANEVCLGGDCVPTQEPEPEPEPEPPGGGLTRKQILLGAGLIGAGGLAYMAMSDDEDDRRRSRRRRNRDQNNGGQ